MEELDEKIKEAEAEFEGKTLEESQKGEKEKVAVEDLTKKALETLAETKKRKQQEGEEVKQTKKSEQTTTENETLAYLREKAAKDHEVRILQMKTENEEAKAQRLLLEQYHHQQQQQQQTQQQILLLLQN